MTMIGLVRCELTPPSGCLYWDLNLGPPEFQSLPSGQSGTPPPPHTHTHTQIFTAYVTLPLLSVKQNYGLTWRLKFDRTAQNIIWNEVFAIIL